MSACTLVDCQDIEIAITILQENTEIFGLTVTEMLVKHLKTLIKNKKDDEGDFIKIEGFNYDIWNKVTEITPYKLYNYLLAVC